MAASQAQQRIVQADGRRYSLRLEPAFWRVLANAAKRRRVLLGRLVAQVAGDLADGGNLASHLRVFCLSEAADKREPAADKSERAKGLNDVSAIVDQCPTPCLVMSRDRHILRTNDAFGQWYGVRDAGLGGKPLDHFFKLQVTPSLERALRSFGSGTLTAAAGKLVYVTPGRVVEAEVRLVPVAYRSIDQFAVLVMVAETPSPQKTPARA